MIVYKFTLQLFCRIDSFFLLGNNVAKTVLTEQWALVAPSLEKAQKDFFLQNSFSYSADAKPMINKNWFEFI